MLFECLVPHDEKPFAVSLLRTGFRSVTNRLLIHYRPPKAMPTVRFTHCISPLYGRADTRLLIQMLEANIKFGVDRFVVYNYSTEGANIEKTLQSYVNDGIVEVIQWNIPTTISPREIQYFGQVAALSDCLYRRMYTTEYMLATDIDELFVPTNPRYASWSDLLAGLDPDKKFDVYGFRNTFFYLLWPDRGPYLADVDARRFNVTYALKVTREEFVYESWNRPKCIWRPDKLWVTKVHMQRGANRLDLSQYDGLLHHYRRTVKHAPAPRPSRLDTGVLRFASDIIRRIKARYERIGLDVEEVCGTGIRTSGAAAAARRDDDGLNATTTTTGEVSAN